MNLGDKEDDNKRIDKRERRYETPGEKEGGILKEPSGAAAYLQNAEQEYGRDRIRLAGGDPEMDQDGRTDDPDHGNQDGRLEKRDMSLWRFQRRRDSPWTELRSYLKSWIPEKIRP